MEPESILRLDDIVKELNDIEIEDLIKIYNIIKKDQFNLNLFESFTIIEYYLNIKKVLIKQETKIIELKKNLLDEKFESYKQLLNDITIYLDKI